MDYITNGGCIDDLLKDNYLGKGTFTPIGGMT